MIFQSTLPTRGATSSGSCQMPSMANFNPRSPHGERRCSLLMGYPSQKFQSTLPTRGATSPLAFCCPESRFQSTLPTRGATHGQSAYTLFPFISIHAPHTGSDVSLLDLVAGILCISIHAPHTGSDCRCRLRVRPSVDFNPRSPHGERRHTFAVYASNGHFNPRSPHGERLPHSMCFSIFRIFQSTLPTRGATRLRDILERDVPEFQSTLPTRGATGRVRASVRSCFYFNPRSPHGERPAPAAPYRKLADFNPRSPHGERPTIPFNKC